MVGARCTEHLGRSHKPAPAGRNPWGNLPERGRPDPRRQVLAETARLKYVYSCLQLISALVSRVRMPTIRKRDLVFAGTTHSCAHKSLNVDPLVGLIEWMVSCSGMSVKFRRVCLGVPILQHCGRRFVDCDKHPIITPAPPNLGDILRR